jgi:hypothetical protein
MRRTSRTVPSQIGGIGFGYQQQRRVWILPQYIMASRLTDGMEWNGIGKLELLIGVRFDG